MPRLKPVLTPDQVLVFDYIKQVRSCSRGDMQVALGLTTAKLSAALELFFVVDKIAEVNDVLYFCESPLPVALRNTLAAGVASTEVTPAQDRANKKAIKPNPSFEQVKAVVQDRRCPKDINEVIELLKLPRGVYPLFGMVMGYPLAEGDEKAKPRLPLEVVYKENEYQTAGDEELIREYDEVIRNYYIERTGGQRNETWTQQMSDFVAKPQRPGLKAVLQEQGFALK